MGRAATTGEGRLPARLSSDLRTGVEGRPDEAAARELAMAAAAAVVGVRALVWRALFSWLLLGGNPVLTYT